jgi:hypothetical protein
VLKPRDQQLAELIATTEAGVEALARRIGSSVEHATAHDALAHAALYEHVQGCLTAAAKQLRRAHEVMLNGDAEDYA